MPKIEYVPRDFKPATLDIIDKAEVILDDHEADGFDMTLRQLYYQFIGLDLFPEDWIDEEYNRKRSLPTGTKNTDKNYKRLVGIISKARLAGLLDWEQMVDRTRRLEEWRHYENPENAIQETAEAYAIDMWERQDKRVEVWVEKEALIGVLERAASELDMPYFACKGSPSQSAMWRAANRLNEYVEDGKAPLIIYLGDHDPTGLDMSRDIQDRLATFDCPAIVLRIALNYEQVRRYRLPPNPTKTTDSRAKAYMEEFGDESWEVDALGPRRLVDIIRKATADLYDKDQWKEDLELQNQGREFMQNVSDRWSEIVEFMGDE